MVKAVAIGASAGGVETLHQVLSQLPETLPYALFIVQHRKDNGHNYLCQTLQRVCHLPVVEAEDKMTIRAGHLYVAPPDYHLLIESQSALALSLDAPLHYCRPAIDLLYSSAAAVFGQHLIAAVFSGMGCDGAVGLRKVHQLGGRCMVQLPQTTAYPSMPQAALNAVPDASTFAPDVFFQTLSNLVAIGAVEEGA